MLHNNKEEFLKVLERTSAQTGFPLQLLEKDYYLTIVLPKINELSTDLIFKGGTCLSKIYFSYYRLSEDLDFTLKLPSSKNTRGNRRKAILPIKSHIKTLLQTLKMDVNNIEKAGHNESTQYIYFLEYNSVVLEKEAFIKLEIGLRANPINDVEIHNVNHKFLHPFTGEPLFESGNVWCLSLKELVAEKLRAAATRQDIAARDYYDLWSLINKGFDFKDKECLRLFKKKLEEDSFSPDLNKYRYNMGRSNKEITEMKSRVSEELFPILTLGQQKIFDMQKALDEINNIFQDIV